MADSTPELKSIFGKAIQIQSPAERHAYLEQVCAGDSRLQAEVESLLQAQPAAEGFFEGFRPGPAVTIDAPISECAGTMIGPYKLLQQIGEGGMGTVYMAEQTQPIQRKVALKIIKAGMDSKQVVARFEAERQALAMMDHVNIARVFDAGTTVCSDPINGVTTNGRPYFVMELVHGVPITKYCDDNHLTPRERLELFVPVCQAIQHAHQKGIIHRDIKPSNVMVTLYDGKPVPKVIDFGVAKATEQKLTERTLFTQYGTMVGTLEYMSPEQAEMSALGVDTRSDIYSLGVLLYELLTGNTPLTHLRMKQVAYAEILRMIKEDEPQKPSTRLSDSGEALASISANRHTEPAKLSKLMRGELDWIVMKTLEKDRNRRYATANGFAMDVQRYLADEPVLACPPSAGYRLRKFARRNKPGLAVAALVLLFLVLLGSGAGWAVRDRSAREAEAARQQADRQAKMAGQVQSILAEVDRLEKEQKWPEALAAARRAEAAVAGGEADAATAQRVHQRLKDLAFIDRLERTRMLRATWVGGRFDDAGADREYARAFRDYGVDVLELAVETSIDRLKARPALAIPLAAALDDWVHCRRALALGDTASWKRLVAVARGIDPEPLRDRVRATWGQPVAEVQDDLCRLAESIDIRAQHPATLVSLAYTLQRVKRSDSALRLLRDAQYVYPGDFWLNFSLGAALSTNKDHEGAIRFYTAAVAIRPNMAAAHNNLGIALSDHEKLDEAIAAYKKAIELDPKHAFAHYNLGTTLYGQEKLDEAITYYKKAIELAPIFADAHYNLGNALRDQKKLDEAIRHYRTAIDIDPRSDAFNNLGLALAGQKKLDDAIDAHRMAIKLNPKSHWAYNCLGLALLEQKKLDEAIDCYKKAIEINPKFADAYSNLGNALRDQKKLDESIRHYRTAIELDPKSTAGYNGLGIALRNQKKLDEAIDAHRKAIELAPKGAIPYNHLGIALDLQKNLPGAIDAYRKAIELDPKYSAAYNNLAIALAEQKKLDEAIVAHRKAIELDPKNAECYSSLGVTLSNLKKWDEAIECFRAAIKLDPQFANAYCNLGLALQDQKKLPEAVAAFRKAIELDPQFAIAYCNLGALLCDDLKEYDKAIECFREAIKLDPKFANASKNLGIAQRHKALALISSPDAKLRDPKRALEAIKEAVELAIPDSQLTWQYLGWIQYRTGDWKSSIEALEKSCKLQKGGTGDAGQWIVLALAHAKLAAQDGLPEKEREHHRTEARRRYEEADKQIERWWRARPGHVIGQAIWDFRVEAREFLGAKEK